MLRSAKPLVAGIIPDTIGSTTVTLVFRVRSTPCCSHMSLGHGSQHLWHFLPASAVNALYLHSLVFPEPHTTRHRGLLSHDPQIHGPSPLEVHHDANARQLDSSRRERCARGTISFLAPCHVESIYSQKYTGIFPLWKHMLRQPCLNFIFEMTITLGLVMTQTHRNIWISNKED